MMSLLGDLVILLAVLWVTAVSLFGWGRLAWRCLGYPTADVLDTQTIWLGFSFVLSALEIVHLFVAIDWRVSLSCVVVGVIGVLWSGKDHASTRARLLLERLRSYRAVDVLMVLGLLLLCCLRAMGEVNNYDSGLYHFQSIRWLNEHPVVLGLANLHWRLGLNQAYFDFLALLNVAPYWGKGYAAGGLFLLLLTGATLIEHARTKSKTWVYSLGATSFVFLGMVASSVVNPSPDNAVALLELVIFFSLYEIWIGREHKGLLLRDATALLFLCLAVVLSKFSAIGFVMGALLLLLVQMYCSRTLKPWLRWRFVAIVVLFVGVHVLRGYLYSGAPLFPSVLLGWWDLPWAISPDLARAETRLIFDWARSPGVNAAGQVVVSEHWLLPWLSAMPSVTRAVFATCIGLSLLNLVVVLKNRTLALRKSFALYVPLYAGLLFWFLTAPDVRFLGAVLALSLGFSLYLALRLATASVGLQRFNLRQFDRRPVHALICLGIGLVSLRFVGLTSLSFHGWSAVPAVVTVSRPIANGQMVRIPSVGNQCWDAPLPCASLLNNNLSIRQNAQGFTVFSVNRP